MSDEKTGVMLTFSDSQTNVIRPALTHHLKRITHHFFQKEF